jgi:UDP-2-acetamido-3-amino-2,3-dideoxy-glucuronate N-acetyltransferase
MKNLIENGVEIAPTAVIETGVTIGAGTEVMHGAYISTKVTIGRNCFIGYNTVIRPNVIIGDNSHVRSLVFVAENVSIGKNCKIIQFSNLCKNLVLEDDVFLGTGVLTYDTKKISHMRNYKPIGEPPYICRGSRVGSGVRINPGVTIMEGSMIDAASVVTKDTEPYGKYRGFPAIKIGEVPENERV